MGWYSNEHYRANIDIEKAVHAKMKILRDFYVVDDDNYEEIFEELITPLRMHPEWDVDRRLDRAAMTLIQGKLGRPV